MATNFRILLQGIRKTYESGEGIATVLAGVDWAIEPGETAVLLGTSGSGKSTLINLLAGLDQPDSGQILFEPAAGKHLDWHNLSDYERTRFRLQHIGVVFQFFNLLPTLTVWENVVLPLHLAGNSQAEKIRMQDLLDELGLLDKASSLPQNLSGGERQKVAIVRSLANSPSLILADEPTGNLDAQTSQLVIQLLVHLCKTQGVTLVVATHALEWTLVAETVKHLENGRLADAT